MADINTRNQIDNALNYVVRETENICRAHTALGAPLEDLLCHAIRESFRRRLVDLDKQEVTRLLTQEDNS